MPSTTSAADRYGGSFDNRTRVLFELIAGIRATTAPGFQLGLRLSPERFDIRMSEALALAQQVMAGGQIDYLDMSLWDCFKPPQDPAYAERPLIEHFAALRRARPPGSAWPARSWTPPPRSAAWTPAPTSC